MRRRAITITVVLDVLRNGIIDRKPEPDIKTGSIVCRMERYCAGKPMTAMVALKDETASECVVVTTFISGD